MSFSEDEITEKTLTPEHKMLFLFILINFYNYQRTSECFESKILIVHLNSTIRNNNRINESIFFMAVLFFNNYFC